MTRTGEIKQQVDIYTDDASNYAEWSDDGGWTESNDIDLVEKAFIEGAKWADRTLIKKACEWMREEFYTSKDRDGHNILVSASWDNVEELIKDFEKQMEE